MNGSVLFEGNPLLSGSLNVNSGGNIEPLEIEINENGTREITPPSGVDGYAPITIETDVPQIVPILETLNVTQNGRYEPPEGVAGFDEVNVEVLHPLDTLNVTENGSYEPPTGVYGFSNVNVNVPIPTPTLETLNITANGTYTPPSGVDGYDEINVNVPGPENALVIKNYEGVPTSIASFTDGTSNPLKSLTASIVPVQAGSGDPSPENVRPITGWTGANIVNMSDITNKTFFEGLLNGTYGVVDLGSLNWVYASNRFECVDYIGAKKGEDRNAILCPIYPFLSSGTADKGAFIGALGTRYELYVYNNDYDSESTFKTAMLGVYLIYELATPTTPTITPQQFNTLLEAFNIDGLMVSIPFTDGQGQSVEVFGGSVDVVNGTSGNKKIYDIVVFDGSEDEDITAYNAQNGAFWLGTIDSMKDYSLSSQIPPFVSDYLKAVSQSSAWISGVISEDTNNKKIIACLSNFGTSVAECRQYLSQHPLTIRYELATPTTFYTQPTSIKSLDGVNNVFASTGDVEVLKYFTRATS